MLLTLALAMLSHPLFALGATALALGACATMAPTGSAELGAALDSCGACPASPQPRDWRLIDRVDPARGARPNGEVTTKWSGHKAQDGRGRYTHVASIRIVGNVQVTMAGATNDAVSAYQMRSLFHLMHLSDVGGLAHFARIDGRSVLDDYFMRHGRLPYVLDGAIPKDIGAGTYTFPIDLEIALQSRARGANPTECLMLLAALQRADGSQGFRFSLRATIAGAPAGIVVNKFIRGDGQDGLDVRFEPVMLDLPMADAAWTLREYTIAEANGSSKRKNGKTEYFIARYFPEDYVPAPGVLAGQQLAAGIDSASFEVAGAKFAESRDFDLAERQLDILRTYPDGAAQLGLPLLGLPVESGVTMGMLIISPQRSRETAPAGPIVFQFERDPNATNVRYLHRVTECDSSERAARIGAAVHGDDPCTCWQPSNPTTVTGAPTFGVSDATAPKALVPIQRPG